MTAGDPGPAPSTPTWYEVADALWLATRAAGLVREPSGPAPADPPPESGPTRPDHPDQVTGRPARQPSATGEGRAGPIAPTLVVQHPARAIHRPDHQLRTGRAGATRPLADRAVARVLRPLRQLVPSGPDHVLDEPATADLAAQDPDWRPVLRPVDAPRWDLLLVVDDHASMVVWQATVAGFIELVRRQGAFRDVRVYRFDTDGKQPSDLAVRGTGAGRPRSAPAGLLTATGRRIGLVLTDGTAPAWHAGAALPVLRTWAARMPVAIVHLLPHQQWHHTGLHPAPIRLRAPGPGAANRQFTWQRPEPAWLEDSAWLGDPDRPDDPAATPVPVLELRPSWLAAWVRLVARSPAGWTDLPAVLAGPWRPSEVTERWPDDRPRPDAQQQVRHFTARATPTALALATQLAAAPLNLPVIHAVQRELLPGSDPSHLAELMHSGLLHRVVPPAEVGAPDRVAFDFDPGVREELLAAGRCADTVRVLRLVDQCLGATVPAVAGLRQVLADPERAPDREPTPDAVPFLRAEQAALRALSGRYLARSRRLEQALPPPEPVRDTVVGSGAVTTQTPTTVDQISSGSEGAGVSPRTMEEAVAPSAARHRVPTRAPAIWGNIPPKNPNFTGREALLDLLHERLQAGTTAVLPHALHGMGGVGKSQLAAEYVYRHQGDYNLIWWVSAASPTTVQAALVELAQRMELPVGLDATTAVPAVREALRLGEPYANWMLVFDNAESPESIRSYFPNGGPGSIMVTSRNPQWQDVAQSLEVDVFARAESLRLLRRRRAELDDAELDRVAETLGDLPLAIDQAAVWLAETGMSATDYLRLFDEKRGELLEASVPVDYPLSVAAAWNVSLDRLRVSHPAALRLLQVCSLLAPEPVARTLLDSGHHGSIHSELDDALQDPMALNRAIREIHRYALARIDYRTDSLMMHRLVQAVITDQMSDEDRDATRGSAHQLLAASGREDPVKPAHWQRYSDLYPHVVASGAVRATDPQVMRLVDNTAQYLYWWGDHDAAREMSQQAFDARTGRLGRHHPATLKIGRWLGFMLFVVGRYQQAEELNQQILVAHQATGGEDTEELLAAIGAVAADRRVAGNFAAALEIDEDLYHRHLRLLGEEEPATLNAAHNLAVSLRLVGDLRRARDIDEVTEASRIQLFSADHPITLESTRNLITDHRELGDYVQAQAQQQDVVDRLRRLVSPGHPRLLKAQRSLSVAMRKAGNHEVARQTSEEVRDGFATRYGRHHPDTLVASLNLSIDLRATGRLAEAAELSAEVRDGYQQLLGEGHPHTLAAAVNQAVVHRLRGELSAALRLDQTAHERLAELLGPDHPHTLCCAVNLASDLYALERFPEAQDRDADAAERLRRVFGEDHPTTLACLGNLAMDLTALDAGEEARMLHADTVARFQRILGPEHPATVAAADLTLRADCDLDPMPL